MLVVTVLRASDLPARDDAPADPYVKLQLLPEKKHRVKTRVLRRTNNPVYEVRYARENTASGRVVYVYSCT